MSWARAVKHRTRTRLPVLWLFTDAARLPDPLSAIARLPRGMTGIVFRHDGAPNRLALAMQVARLCRRRRLALVIAADPRLAWRLKAGLHLRGGSRPGFVRPPRGLVTASVHDPAEYRRALRAGARLCFLSPAFATQSHPDAKPLGAIRWASLSRHGPRETAYALGGITGQTMKRLARQCRGAGAIDALHDGIKQ
jgi:thiamine-phosphate pyrophosphorylase